MGKKTRRTRRTRKVSRTHRGRRTRRNRRTRTKTRRHGEHRGTRVLRKRTHKRMRMKGGAEPAPVVLPRVERPEPTPEVLPEPTPVVLPRVGSPEPTPVVLPRVGSPEPIPLSVQLHNFCVCVNSKRSKKLCIILYVQPLPIMKRIIVKHFPIQETIDLPGVTIETSDYPEYQPEDLVKIKKLCPVVDNTKLVYSDITNHKPTRMPIQKGSYRAMYDVMGGLKLSYTFTNYDHKNIKVAGDVYYTDDGFMLHKYLPEGGSYVDPRGCYPDIYRSYYGKMKYIFCYNERLGDKQFHSIEEENFTQHLRDFKEGRGTLRTKRYLCRVFSIAYGIDDSIDCDGNIIQFGRVIPNFFAFKIKTDRMASVIERNFDDIEHPMDVEMTLQRVYMDTSIGCQYHLKICRNPIDLFSKFLNSHLQEIYPTDEADSEEKVDSFITELTQTEEETRAATAETRSAAVAASTAADAATAAAADNARQNK